MNPQEVTDCLKLSQLKDKIWYVVPSCATTGEGLLEGLVRFLCPFSLSISLHLAVSNHHPHRHGSQTTSNTHRYKSRNKTFPSFTKNALRHSMNSWFLGHGYFSLLCLLPSLKNEPSRHHRHHPNNLAAPL
jgi:hypothetical protein